jgi:type II protein arginine methyltransferase
MMAARAGAARVIACESVGVLAEAALEIIKNNGLDDRIQILHKHSSALAVGADLERPADLLVAEIVDCGLLSEGVLDSIVDARARLLAPGGTIIPRSAVVYAMPIECPALDAEQRVGMVSGFDLSPINGILPRSYRQIEISRHGWHSLAAPVELFRFDFTTAMPVPDEHDVRLIPIADGIAHAIVAWFRLELDDEVAIASGPYDPPTHWRQAVFPLAAPVELNQNEPVRLHAGHDGRTLRLSLSARARRDPVSLDVLR